MVSKFGAAIDHCDWAVPWGISEIISAILVTFYAASPRMLYHFGFIAYQEPIRHGQFFIC